jgi:hypothetical protein
MSLYLPKASAPDDHAENGARTAQESVVETRAQKTLYKSKAALPDRGGKPYLSASPEMKNGM